jgi:DNA-binding NarL/FixJ family response regulator
MSQTIAITVSNLIFQSRVRSAALELGLEVAYADTAASFTEAMRRRPAVVVVDLKELNLDPIDAIARAKAAGAAVLAFGPHTDAETLRAARSAGADLAVPRSRFKAELTELLRSLAGARTDVGG